METSLPSIRSQAEPHDNGNSNTAPYSELSDKKPSFAQKHAASLENVALGGISTSSRQEEKLTDQLLTQPIRERQCSSKSTALISYIQKKLLNLELDLKFVEPYSEELIHTKEKIPSTGRMDKIYNRTNNSMYINSPIFEVFSHDSNVLSLGYSVGLLISKHHLGSYSLLPESRLLSDIKETPRVVGHSCLVFKSKEESDPVLLDLTRCSYMAKPDIFLGSASELKEEIKTMLSAQKLDRSGGYKFSTGSFLSGTASTIINRFIFMEKDGPDLDYVTNSLFNSLYGANMNPKYAEAYAKREKTPDIY
ncbi:hypothetical protein [Endozoicomonas sp.]|uniref:hypothetical protein n=1 Tax=Endozoicomonas sp. TaxID=1892382 RepID=UPI0028860823|nr:hypothetical protein [Endozoicomonas sp.]